MNKDIIRFMSKIQKSEIGCWIWLGSRMGKGYGKMYPNGKEHGDTRALGALRGAFEFPAHLKNSHSTNL